MEIWRFGDKYWGFKNIREPRHAPPIIKVLTYLADKIVEIATKPTHNARSEFSINCGLNIHVSGFRTRSTARVGLGLLVNLATLLGISFGKFIQIDIVVNATWRWTFRTLRIRTELTAITATHTPGTSTNKTTLIGIPTTFWSAPAIQLGPA